MADFVRHGDGFVYFLHRSEIDMFYHSPSFVINRGDMFRVLLVVFVVCDKICDNNFL